MSPPAGAAHGHSHGPAAPDPAALGSARRWVYLLFFAVNAVGLWGVLYPRSYGLAVGAQAVLPLLALLLMFRLKGRVRFDDTGRSPYPSVAYAFVVPTLALAYRSSLRWQILAWDRFWIPFGAIGAVLFAAVLFCAPEVRKGRGTAFVVGCFCLAYAYGLLVHVNCYFDGSWPESYVSRVRAHQASHGQRTTTYSLVVSPWLNQPVEHRIRVPRNFYGERADGDSVRISLHRGFLGMPWYEAF